MESVVKAVMQNDWAGLKKHFEGVVADKIMAKVNTLKSGVLAQVNGVDEEKMTEILSTTSSK